MKVSIQLSLIGLFYIICTIEPIIEYFAKNGDTVALLTVRLISDIYAAVCFYGLILGVNKDKPYRFLMKICFLLFFINSLICANKYGFQGAFHSGMIMMGIVGGFWLLRYEYEQFVKATLYTVIIGIIGFFIILLRFDLSITSILLREYVWTEIFFWAGIYWAVVPAVLLFVISGKYEKLGYVYWGLGVALSIIFLKRFIIIDSLLLFLMIVYLRNKRAGKRRLCNPLLIMSAVIFLGGMMILLVPAMTQLFETVVGRFTGENLLKFDRLVESMKYYRDIDVTSFVFGKGAWGVGHFLSTSRITSALHIGWSNFVFKGGIICLALFAIPTLKAFVSLKRINSYTCEAQFAIAFLVVSAVRLLYINYYELSPSLMLLSWSCIKVMELSPRADEYEISRKQFSKNCSLH